MMKYKRVLTIDDDNDINKLLDDILTKEGYIVTTSTTFNEFFEKFKHIKPDLCLIDLNLQDIKGAGYNILKTLRKIVGKEIKIIMISRRTAEEDIQEALKLGADDFITKPLDRTTVSAKVNSAFDDMFKDSTYLPYFAAPAATSEAMLDLEMNVISLNEEGILLFSKNLIAKGNTVHLAGDLIKDLSKEKFIRGVVTDVERTNEPLGYQIHVSFNVEDEETLKCVRQMLVGL
ncbi:hypothetical protein A9Q84_11975 [Halobacteriovorax marinus]|uniref:Response regulatory domain-containing protein n=1 Tax=Halobacteriovorax marinus TaxID=97084 RepID=A0A1Y5F835_9BACT|nr:hypothetical protein A9Q84_11975 [Halobacteriovorax marinus]